MAHHVLDSVQWNVLVIQLGGIRVSEHAWCHKGFDARLFGLFFDNALQPVILYGPIGFAREKGRKFFMWR